jgi:uncharacterized protein (DUF1499 family)
MKNPGIEIGFILGIISLVLFLISGPGTRIGLYPFTVGLILIAAGALAGLAAIIVSVIRLISGTPGPALQLAGMLTGAVSFGIVAFTILTAGNAPPIHDITTDTVNPPEFVSILPLRKNALNPPLYGGRDTAAKQAAAFPDIKTIFLHVPQADAFGRAMDAVRKLKWVIADYNPEEGRIEATDTTFWFGFKDDIVIRVLPRDGGSAVDIRSESRAGLGDLGTNAARVRKFMKLIGS